MDEFAEYIHERLKKRAAIHMADARMFFEKEKTPADEGIAAARKEASLRGDCGQSECTNPRCGCNLPDHDQRAEGLGDVS